MSTLEEMLERARKEKALARITLKKGQLLVPNGSAVKRGNQLLVPDDQMFWRIIPLESEEWNNFKSRFDGELVLPYSPREIYGRLTHCYRPLRADGFRIHVLFAQPGLQENLVQTAYSGDPDPFVAIPSGSIQTIQIYQTVSVSLDVSREETVHPKIA